MLGHLMGFMGFHGGFWREKTTPNGKACPLRVIFGVGYVGPMLGCFGSMLGPCWVIWWLFFGFHGSFRREETNPNGTACPLRFILGDFFRLCRANVGAVLGLCWAMLGHLMGFWGSMEVSRRKKANPNGKACPLRFILGEF